MFQWLRDRAKAKKLYEQDLNLALNAKRLYGVNLEQWHYLGHTEITYTIAETKETIRATVHLFAFKNDLSRRHWELVAEQNFYFQQFVKHNWITNTANLWRVGEEELYNIIQVPSRWLREYMLEEYNCVWDQKKKWWATKPKIDSVEGNVVKLDFNKEKS